MKLNQISSSRIKKIFSKIYRLIRLALRLLQKAIANPKYIPLCFWAFKQLSWVDRDLQNMAIAALKTPTQNSLPPLNSDLKQAIRERAVAIFWTTKIHPLRPKCLHRSLALYHWLLEQGVSPKLEIGWGGDIGHAWVTYDGLALNDSPNVAESMTLFTRF